MGHAIAPGAKILLVEANSASYSNLFAAVQYVARQPSVVAVSMSWGSGEFSGETSYDSVFTPPASNPAVVFVTSSGDAGAPASYPSTSPNVLSVGGTSLYLSGSNYSGESAWSGSGGGISAYESQPAYQKGVVTQTTTMRANPDVAYDADPNTGFSVYQTYGNSGGPWLQYGGTSAGAPQWAALIAIADQGRAAGKAALSSSALPMAIYQLPSPDFHDVSTGASTGSPRENAGTGYDLATGRGSPIANRVVADLVGSSNSNTNTSHFAVGAPTSVTAGTSFTITVTAQDANGNALTGYTGTVHFSNSDVAAGLPANYTFTTADHGSHTFAVTLNTPGTQSVSVVDTASASIFGSAAAIQVNSLAASTVST